MYVHVSDDILGIDYQQGRVVKMLKESTMLSCREPGLLTAALDQEPELQPSANSLSLCEANCDYRTNDPSHERA